MRSGSTLLLALFALTVLVAPVSAHAILDPRFNVRGSMQVDRPTRRTTEQNAVAKKNLLNVFRKSFKSSLQQIEAKRQLTHPQSAVEPSPDFTVDTQGYVPYNWFRTRRSVRHVYWQNYFQEVPQVQIGQGAAGTEGFVAPGSEETTDAGAQE